MSKIGELYGTAKDIQSINQFFNGGRHEQLSNCIYKSLNKVKDSPSVTDDHLIKGIILLTGGLDSDPIYFLDRIISDSYVEGLDHTFISWIEYYLEDDIVIPEDQKSLAVKIFVESIEAELPKILDDSGWRTLVLDFFKIIRTNQNLVQSSLTELNGKIVTILKALQIDGIDYPMEYFIDYFPTYKSLSAKYLKIDLKWFAKENPHIKDLWTDVRLIKYIPKKDTSVWNETENNEFDEDEAIPPIYKEIKQIFSSTNRILIQGPGGSGKTTLLKFIRWKLLQEPVNKRILPIYIQLHEFSKTKDSLESFVIKSIREVSGDTLDEHIRFSDIAACFELWFLIDAVDEIRYLTEGVTHQKIEGLLRQNPNSKVIITSRPTSKLLDYLKQYPTYLIPQINKSQFSSYLVKLLQFVFPNEVTNAEESMVMVQEIFDKLELTGLLSIIDTYFMATIFSMVHQNPRLIELQSKYEVIGEAVEALIDAWDGYNKREGITQELSLERSELYEIISYLAQSTLEFSTAEGGLGMFSSSDLFKAVNYVIRERSDFIQDYKRDPRKITSALFEYLLERAGFKPTSGELLNFQHRIIRDYLASIHIKTTTPKAIDFIEAYEYDEVKLSIISFVIAGIFIKNKSPDDAAKCINTLFKTKNIGHHLIPVMDDLYNLGVNYRTIVRRTELIDMLVQFGKYIDQIPDLSIIEPDDLVYNIDYSPFLNFIFNINWDQAIIDEYVGKNYPQVRVGFSRKSNQQIIALGLLALLISKSKHFRGQISPSLERMFQTYLNYDYQKNKILINDSELTNQVSDLIRLIRN